MIEAVAGVSPSLVDPVLLQIGVPTPAVTQAPGVSFGSILAGGLRSMEAKVHAANDLVRQFALDDSVPLHRVTYALEEARLAVELTMQVRSRLVESYREFMNMQL